MNQRGFGVLAYGLIALAVLGAIASLIAWADRNIETTAGIKRGNAETKAEWNAANAAAQQKAEAERSRIDALRATQDKEATRRLANAHKSNAALLTSLEAHIRVARLPADCRISEQLRDDANRALAGPEGQRTGIVPSGTGPAATAR